MSVGGEALKLSTTFYIIFHHITKIKSFMIKIELNAKDQCDSNYQQQRIYCYTILQQSIFKL